MISALRLASLFSLFSLIAFGLGYPTLSRYDPRRIPGLIDVKSYSAIVTAAPVPGPEHLRFRVLVPWVARPFSHLAGGRLGSWDPVMFGLLCANSLFVAGTAVLLVVLGTRQIGGYAVSLVASLLYLVNFAVPNLRLVGLVDAGEGLFLLALLWSLSEVELWCLPAIAVLGTLTKESFIPLSVAFTAAWWVVARKKLESPVLTAIWIISGWTASFVALIGLHWWVDGGIMNPMQFATTLRGEGDYLGHLASSLWDRNFWYVFLWLLPLGIPKLKNLPKSWLIPTVSSSLMVFVLDAYYRAAPGTVGRALFSTTGPVLALSSAKLLLDNDADCLRAAHTGVCVPVLEKERL